MTFIMPNGKELQKLERVVEPFVAKDYADVMSREDWLACVEAGGFIPYDGHLGEIVIDGYLTVYQLEGWGLWSWLEDENGKPLYTNTDSKGNPYRVKPISMDELKALEGNVQVCWYNK